MFVNEESTRGITAKKLLFVLKYMMHTEDGVPEEVVTELKATPKELLPLIADTIMTKFECEDTQAKFCYLLASMTDKQFIEGFCEMSGVDPATIEL